MRAQGAPFPASAVLHPVSPEVVVPSGVVVFATCSAAGEILDGDASDSSSPTGGDSFLYFRRLLLGVAFASPAP